MVLKKTVLCKSLADTKSFAQSVASSASAGMCFALYGDLGAGKTTFAQYFIKHILQNDNIDIPSPTFPIVQIYEFPRIVHMDCYRIEDQNEFLNLGVDEIIGESITLIEWPEKISNFLPANTISVRFSVESHDNRRIEIDCAGLCC